MQVFRQVVAVFDMSSESSSHDRPLGRDQLEFLIQHRLFSKENHEAVRAEFRESIDWSRWLGHRALAIGAVLVGLWNEALEKLGD
jgi:hypothetical protein